MHGCMTTMPIDNHPLTKRRLQLIGISVNKLTLKSINTKQSSNNYSIFSSIICRNQSKVSSKNCDKWDDFNFEIVNSSFLDGDDPRSPSYGIYIFPSLFVLLECVLKLMTET